MSVVLIGYRGSGKTTLGRGLAAQLGWAFIDQDQEIVHAADMSIRDIFLQHGEPHFRAIETQHLLKSLRLKNHVISLGGGAVVAEENRRAIIAAGHLVVYLKADVEELHRRILADPTTAEQRPSLTLLGGSLDEIRMIVAKREPMYFEVMTLELNVQGKPIEQLVDELTHHFQQHVTRHGNETDG